MGEGDPFAHGVSAEDVFGEDSIKAVWGDGAVPDALGVDEEPWSSRADAEAEGFCAHDGRGRLFDGGFGVFPQGVALVWVAAFGADAEEEVLLCGGDACFFKQGGDGVRHAGVRIGGKRVVVEGLS